MDNIDRLLEAINHPEMYTDEELDSLLSDKEVRETYSLMTNLRIAQSKRLEPDVDAEWESFALKHFGASANCKGGDSRENHGVSLLRFFNRNAAAIIISVVVSLAAVAAGIGINASFDHEETDAPVAAAKDREEISITDTDTPTEIKATAEEKAPEIIVFKNESLESIVNNIAAYHNVTATFKSDNAKSLRLYFKWDQALTLEETIAMLNNFEHISIAIQGDTLTVE